MRIAVFGAGGVGGYLGARLAAAGNEVGFVARGAHLEAMRAAGLRVHSPDGDIHLGAPRASAQPRDLGPVDLVLVAVKSWQLEEAARSMGPLLGERTVVLPLLNGVDAPAVLTGTLGGDRVLGGLCKLFAWIERPGVVRHYRQSRVEFGELDGRRSRRAQAIAEVLSGAGIETVLSTDIGTDLWRKLVLVSSWAGIGALTRQPLGVLREDGALRALIDRAMGEGIAVARGLGHDPGAGAAARFWGVYDALPRETTASMQRDIMQGRRSELEAWNGAVVRHGERTGVPTPVHALTCDLLRPMERQAARGGNAGVLNSLE